MIKEAYVSFEVAKLLREKKFKYNGHLWYDEYGVITHVNTVIQEPTYPCSTQQMVIRWLREKYNLFIEIIFNSEDTVYPMFDAYVHNLKTCERHQIIGYNRYSYEEAVETAIKYCLEHLVKIE